MEEIKIVEYNHSLAGQVADMWNKSFDSWGGRRGCDKAA